MIAAKFCVRGGILTQEEPVTTQNQLTLGAGTPRNRAEEIVGAASRPR